MKNVRVKGAIGVVEIDRIDDLDGLRTHFIEQGVFIRPIGKHHLSDASFYDCVR